MKKLSLITVASIVLLSSCAQLTTIFMTANSMKDHYCEFPEADRELVMAKIHKVFPDYKSVCNIPDIIPSR